jgi:hypothetical protein
MDPVIETFETDLQLYVAEAARRRIFVHAGVVGWRGRALIIPGKSFSGKSTLVAALVRAGATFYSDEYAVFDARGRVHPYLKPLSLRGNNGDKPQKYSVGELGGSCDDKPLPVGWIFVSDYHAGAKWKPRRVSEGQGAIALFANTVSARRQPAVVLSTLGQVVKNAMVLKGTRGEAADVVDYVLNHFDN